MKKKEARRAERLELGRRAESNTELWILGEGRESS
jgi:hypothetical protein